MLKTKKSREHLLHKWSLVCTGVSVDINSNNATLFNIISQINTSRKGLVPISASKEKNEDGVEFAVPIQFVLISTWKNLDKERDISADILIKVVDPAGVEREAGKFQVKILAGKKYTRTMIQWSGIKVTKSGEYTFRLFKKELNENKYGFVGDVDIDVLIDDDTIV